MKTLLHIIFSTFLLTIFSCNNSGQLSEKTVERDILTTEDENTGIKLITIRLQCFKAFMWLTEKELNSNNKLIRTL